MTEKIGNNSKGFGIIELLIILAFVGLLGLVGWYIYDKNQSKNASVSKSTSEQNPASQSEAYTPPDG